MAAKFPIALDDATTLGGPFIDVVPPVDPQRNIAAEFRNNTNDIALAIEQRIGVIGSAVATSLDWGLLTVGATPNQGVRFQGTHAAWPALTTESGLFIDSASGNVAYHKSGDPLGTFTDLTGGGVATWNDLYAASQAMTIGALNPLTWTQSAVSGIGFKVDRNQAVSDAPTMRLENLNAADNQPVLSLSAQGTDTLYIDHPESPGNHIRCYDTTNARNILTVTGEGTVELTADIVPNLQLTQLHTGAVAGNFIDCIDTPYGSRFSVGGDGQFRVNAGLGPFGAGPSITLHGEGASTDSYIRMTTGVAHDVRVTSLNNGGFTFTPAANIGALKVITTTSVGSTYSLRGVDSTFTSSGMASGDSSCFYARLNRSASDAIVANIDGVYVKQSGTAGAATYCGVRIDPFLTYGIMAGSPCIIGNSDATDTKDVLSVAQYSASTGNLLRLTTLTGDKLVADVLGTLLSTPSAPTVASSSHTIDITSGGIDGGPGPFPVGVVNYLSDITGAGAGVDINSALMCGFKATYTDGGGSNAPIGFWADDTHQIGFYSQSNVVIQANNSGRALEISQDGSGSLISTGKGSASWNLGDTMEIFHEPIPPTAPLDAYWMRVTSGGLTGGALEIISCFKATPVGSALDTNVQAYMSAFAASDFNASGGTAKGVGFSVGSGYEYGLSTLARVSIQSSHTTGDAILTVSNNTASSLELLRVRDGFSGANRLVVTQDGVTTLETSSTVGLETLNIKQNDTDEPFVRYDGTIAGDASTNISTRNGNGIVEGPMSFGGNPGWKFEGMRRESINGVDRWVPFYSEDLS